MVFWNVSILVRSYFVFICIYCMVNLLDDEKVVLMKRRHWYVIASEGAALLFAAALPFAGGAVVWGASPEAADFIRTHATLFLFYGAVWVQMIWMFFFIGWTNYYLDVLMVTNRRVVDVEQIGLFARDMAEMRLENIQDVKVEVIGIIPSLLKMGDLHIQTAGQAKEVYIRHIPEVHEVREAIAHQLDILHQKKFSYQQPVAPEFPNS